MKVILLTNVPKLGKKNDVLEVSDGYANNFLFKKGLACPANSEKINTINAQHDAETRKKLLEKQVAQQTAQKLSQAVVTITAKKGETGKLFGSVTAENIAAALRHLGFEIDKKHILLDAPLRQTGQFKVSAKLHAEATAQFLVIIE